MYAKLWYTQLLSCFVILTGSMLRCFYGDKIIKVHVANGSTINIWCRIAGDKMLMVQGETGGGFDMHGIGVNAHNAEHFEHVAGATRGYSQIQRGNTLAFEASTSSNSVYMTIINESGSTICKNHEISRSRNYIINHRGALLDAKKKNKWIDMTGCNHVISNDDIGEYDTEREDTDHVDFCPNEFRDIVTYDDNYGFDPKACDYHQHFSPVNAFSQTCW